MRPEVAQRLAELNRAFYDAHGEAFAESRPRLAPGVLRVLAGIAPPARVLEAGCGDGKAGRWLARHAPGAVYLGLDVSPVLLDRARRLSPAGLAFRPVDLLAEGWPAALGAGRFDWVLAFAVLHHLPGAAARAGVVRALAGLLAPAGRLAISNWQFTRSPRLRRRMADWAEIGLEAADVEPGDHLLHWERAGRRGLRYVHALEQAEARALADQAGLSVEAVFQDDGHGRDLAEYLVLRAAG